HIANDTASAAHAATRPGLVTALASGGSLGAGLADLAEERSGNKLVVSPLGQHRGQRACAGDRGIAQAGGERRVRTRVPAVPLRAGPDRRPAVALGTCASEGRGAGEARLLLVLAGQRRVGEHVRADLADGEVVAEQRGGGQEHPSALGTGPAPGAGRGPVA